MTSRRVAVFVIDVVILLTKSEGGSDFLPARKQPSCDTSWHQTPFVGVNLGGWLVAENWMWPSQMDGVDAEWTLINKKHGGASTWQSQITMNEHWDTFVTEWDLDRLKKFGVSHLRIPIGYWLLDYRAGDGFVDGGKPYLDRLIGWLKQRCMLAVLDLHALPGGQEAYESFTGRKVSEPGFFLQDEHYQRGNDVVCKLADLILAYEASESTSGVVLGFTPVNEPSLLHWAGERSQQEFYSSVVSTLRDPRGKHFLDPARYVIYLNYMGKASDMVNWILQQPWLRSNIVLDKHVYHKFDTKCDLAASSGGLQDSPHLHPGADHGPQCEWPLQSDSCKTCCRDKWFLEPVVSANLSMIVGEWSVATLTESPVTPQFRQDFFTQQLAFYAGTPGMQGSFFWSFKTEVPQQWKEWCLLWLIGNDFRNMTLGQIDLTLASTCPKDNSQCPDFSDEVMENSLWKATCEWQDIPCTKQPAPKHGKREINAHDTISLVASNGKVVYVEGEIVRLRCAAAGAYQELVVEKADTKVASLNHGDIIYLKGDSLTWDDSFFYLEIDWDPSAPGKSEFVRATSPTIHVKGSEWTAQRFTVERVNGPGQVHSGDTIRLRTLMHKLIGGYKGDVVKAVSYDPSEETSFIVVAV